MNKYKFNLNEINSIETQNMELNGICLEKDEKKCKVNIDIEYEAVYGMGERYNRVNQKALRIDVEVYEKFCNQGENSYTPIPFFFTDTGLGVYLDSFVISQFYFGKTIEIVIGRDSDGNLPEIYFFVGTPKEILGEYTALTGKSVLVPKWSFGAWISANRWSKQEDIEEQVSLQEQHKFPISVIVIEAWSDEATFYRWNTHNKWPNPKEMIQKLHKKNIRLVLWQIPVFKKMQNGENNELLNEDWAYAKANNLCVLNSDGTPYTIPEEKWFSGSMIPDFTNMETRKWWFRKRKHLLDIGVDGFKTDGGEFIYSDDVKVHNGMTGIEMRNAYASTYIEAYNEFCGKDRVLFSRAGYKGPQKYPIQWAGDQESTWEEFKHVIVAGISIGLSGVPFWGFDIAGFAGELPTVELYERATQAAVFTPIMQWHSEPEGGQFSDMLHAIKGTNDRSPWNIAHCYKDAGLLDRLRYHYNLRTNLLPYLYDQAKKSCKTGIPMMKHLIFDYPKDLNVINIEDSFMLGDLLVAPILNEGEIERELYLPSGEWMNIWTKELFQGNQKVLIKCSKDLIPVFLREGGCIALNLSDNKQLGSYVGNMSDSYQNLCFLCAGQKGEYFFSDDMGNEILISWENGNKQGKLISGNLSFEFIN